MYFLIAKPLRFHLLFFKFYSCSLRKALFWCIFRKGLPFLCLFLLLGISSEPSSSSFHLLNSSFGESHFLDPEILFLCCTCAPILCCYHCFCSCCHVSPPHQLFSLGVHSFINLPLDAGCQTHTDGYKLFRCQPIRVRSWWKGFPRALHALVDSQMVGNEVPEGTFLFPGLLS